VNRDRTTHLWILIVGQASLIVALLAAMLKTSLGAPAAEATLSAGTAFATAFGLGLAILGALRRKT
jgi:hypothetical protein